MARLFKSVRTWFLVSCVAAWLAVPAFAQTGANEAVSSAMDGIVDESKTVIVTVFGLVAVIIVLVIGLAFGVRTLKKNMKSA